jgi:hypothetical protein
MNELVRHDGPSAGAMIPAGNIAPAMPPVLVDYLRMLEVHAAERAAWAKAEEAARFRRSGDPDPREQVFVGKPPSVPALDEAGRLMADAALRGYERARAPLSLGVLTAWLMPLIPAVRNPPSEEEMPAKVVGLATLLDDLPAGAFTAETRKAIEGDWFPSAGEIRRAVEPEARRLASMADLLREVSRPPAPPRPTVAIPEPVDDRPPPPDLSALAAKLRVTPEGEPTPERIAADKPKVQPQYLSDQRLVAEYTRALELASDASARAALQMRLDALKRKLSRGAA